MKRLCSLAFLAGLACTQAQSTSPSCLTDAPAMGDDEARIHRMIKCNPRDWGPLSAADQRAIGWLHDLALAYRAERDDARKEKRRLTSDVGEASETLHNRVAGLDAILAHIRQRLKED